MEKKKMGTESLKSPLSHSHLILLPCFVFISLIIQIIFCVAVGTKYKYILGRSFAWIADSRPNRRFAHLWNSWICMRFAHKLKRHQINMYTQVISFLFRNTTINRMMIYSRFKKENKLPTSVPRLHFSFLRCFVVSTSLDLEANNGLLTR